MKIRALPKFEGIKDLERNVFPKAGDVWETNEERANFLKSHGVVEFIKENEENVKPLDEQNVEKVSKKILEHIELKPKKKKRKD